MLAVTAWGRDLNGSGVAEQVGKDVHQKRLKSKTTLQRFGDAKIKLQQIANDWNLVKISFFVMLCQYFDWLIKSLASI